MSTYNLAQIGRKVVLVFRRPRVPIDMVSTMTTNQARIWTNSLMTGSDCVLWKYEASAVKSSNNGRRSYLSDVASKSDERTSGIFEYTQSVAVANKGW